MPNTKYRFTLALKKHPQEKKFTYICEVKNPDDLQGEKERVCMAFEERWGTPIKCVKVEEIK